MGTVIINILRSMKKYNIALLLGATMLSNVVFAQIINNTTIFEKDSLERTSPYRVASDELRRRSDVSVGDALYGVLPGLMVMQGNHGVNLFEKSANLYYRGLSTLGNSSMLILIDGFERDMTNLNIDEIDNIELMTNAVAQTMYGVRGANGALIITTKRGRKGFNSSVNFSYGMDFPFRKPTFADAPTYANALNEALANDGLAPRYSPKEISYMQLGVYPELYPNIDWQDELYKGFGSTYQGNVQFDGGNDKFRYYTTFAYANQSAMFKPTNLDKRYNSQLDKLALNLRINLDVVLAKNTTLKVNLFGRLQEQTRISSLESYFQKLYDTPASAFPVKSSTGAWAANNIYTNPIAEFGARGYANPNKRTLNGDVTITQKLDAVTKGLSAQVSVAYDNMVNYLDARSKTYIYQIITPALDNFGNILDVTRSTYGVDGKLGFNNTMNAQNIANNLVARVDYKTTINNRHKLDAGIVYEHMNTMNNGRNATKKRQSVMALANYSYDEKYIVQGVVNYSGSAVLPKGERFNVYPAISLSWVASKESFLSGSKFVDYLDVYASAGVTGMDLFGHDLYRQFYGAGGEYFFTNSDTPFAGNSEWKLPIKNILSEKSRKINAGFNATLFKKLQFMTEFFYENRSQIMVDGSSTISSVIGIEIPSFCAGEVSNKGVDVSARWSDRIGSSQWGYQISGNFTYAKNKIINNNEERRAEDYMYRTGGSLNQSWGLESVGFFNDFDEINDPNTPKHTFSSVRPGDIRYKDQNGDGYINGNDFVRIGYANIPEIYYGFNVGISRGSFALSAQFQGVANRSVWVKTPSLFMPLQNNTNISSWYLNENVRWTPQTKSSANLPRLSAVNNPNNSQNSTTWLRNGAYFKLRNVELSYTIPKKYTKKIEARLWVAGSNLFSIDDIGYADPEMLSASYPAVESFTFGANITF